MFCRLIPARYVFAFMGLLGTFTTFLLKVNISVAIVDMVDIKSNATDSNTIRNESELEESEGLICSESALLTTGNESSSTEEKFHWTANQQGLVLAGFSYGVAPSQIAMAYLSRRFGHVRVVGLNMLISSVLTTLNPIVAVAGGYGALTAVRILIGMFTANTIIQIFGMAGVWSPPQERSKIISIVFAGVPIGVSFVMPLAGLLASRLGWKSVFYVTGGWGLFWAVLWLFLIHENPESHPCISDKEKEYINSSLKTTTRRSKYIPWSKIFRSWPLYCLIIVHFCSLYGRQTMSSMFPTYLKTVMKLDVTTTGILSAVPFIVNGILLFISGTMADCFITKGFKTIHVRKTFCGIGMVVSAGASIGLAYSGCNVALVVFMGTAIVAMDAFAVPGFKACLLEIAPDLGGVIFGISSTVGSCTGILAPQITSVLRANFISFWICAGLYVCGSLMFTVFGTNEKQPWANPKKDRPSVVTVAETLN